MGRAETWTLFEIIIPGEVLYEYLVDLKDLIHTINGDAHGIKNNYVKNV